MSTKLLEVVGFAGSLRSGSISRLLLRAACQLAPEGMTIRDLDISEIPLFNADLEDQGSPLSVTGFKESVATADGLLIVTPEYNYGIPAVTKNVIDWSSRRNNDPGNVLLNKPVSIMSISGGNRGTGSMARAHVREVLVYPGAIPMPSGDVGISGGQSNFDEVGSIITETTLAQVTQNLLSFKEWIERVS